MALDLKSYYSYIGIDFRLRLKLILTLVLLHVENKIRYASCIMTQKISFTCCKYIAPIAFCFDSIPVKESKFRKSILVYVVFTFWSSICWEREKWMEVPFVHGANKSCNVVLIRVSAWADEKISWLKVCPKLFPRN